jgi:hypothetical protein
LLDSCRNFSNGNVIKIPNEQEQSLLNGIREDLKNKSVELAKKPEVIFAISIESVQSKSSDGGKTITPEEVEKLYTVVQKLGGSLSFNDSDGNGNKDTAEISIGTNKFTYGNLNIENSSSKQR